jgi:hypothetical protein
VLLLLYNTISPIFVNQEPFFIMPLCNVSQTATGVPYSESPRTNRKLHQFVSKSDAIGLVSDQLKVDELILKKERWGSHVLRVLSKISKQTSGGSHVLRVLSKIEFGVSKIEFCALAPDFFIINFRLAYD